MVTERRGQNIPLENAVGEKRKADRQTWLTLLKFLYIISDKKNKSMACHIGSLEGWVGIK